MSKKLFSAMLATAMVASLFTGCGKPKEAPASSSKAEAQASTTAPTEAQAGTVKIGMTLPMTGNNAEYGKTYNIVGQMAADEWNAKGGINGKQIELVVMDSKGDPKEASEIAKKFSANNEIMAVMGDFTSSCCMAAIPIYDENHLTLLAPSGSHPDLAAMSPYMFCFPGRQDGESKFLAKYMTKKYLKKDNCALVVVNNDWGKAGQAHFEKAAEECGLKILSTEAFMEGEKDYNALIAKIRQSNPQAVCIIAQAADSALLTKQIRQSGWKDVEICLSAGAYSEQLLQLGGDELNGSYICTVFYVKDDDAEQQAFLNEFKNRAGYKANQFSQFGYDSMNIILSAVKRADDAGNLTREGIRDEMAKTDHKGYAGPTKFEPAGDINRKRLVCGIENGNFKLLTDYSFMDE
ncbi:MAG: ABC transporter substrate-binding protein [Hydrogenoanaerobacterium sp.]